MGKKAKNAGSKKRSTSTYPNTTLKENLEFIIENPNFSMINYLKTEHNFTDKDIMNDIKKGIVEYRTKNLGKTVEDIINESENPELMSKFMNMNIQNHNQLLKK
tara:strand:+ start:363 stop:674 length:312 start_codon:yes stop_codon:yes gene_type:complete